MLSLFTDTKFSDLISKSSSMMIAAGVGTRRLSWTLMGCVLSFLCFFLGFSMHMDDLRFLLRFCTFNFVGFVDCPELPEARLLGPIDPRHSAVPQKQVVWTSPLHINW